MTVEWINDPPVDQVEASHVAAVAKAFALRLRTFDWEEDRAAGVHAAALAASARLSDARSAGLGRKARSAEAMVEMIASEFSRTVPPADARVFIYRLAEGAEGIAGIIQVTIEAKALKIDYLAAHPLAENAGDILIEYVLRLAPSDPPLVTLIAADQEAMERYLQLGFVSVGPIRVLMELRLGPDSPDWHRVGGTWRRTRSSTGKVYKQMKYMTNLRLSG